MHCLLQFHIATEESKFGLSLEEAKELLTSNEFLNLKNIKIVCVMGIAGGSGTLLLIYGARKAELSKIMPFDYIEIFFALILGWIFFAEWPVDQLFPGALFIVLGGLIIYLQQRKNNFQRLRKR